MDDNLYPSGGYKPNEPVEQKRERIAEQGEAMAAKPVIEKVLAHLDQRIAFYDSIQSIPAEVKNNPEKFMHTVEGNYLAKINLTNEREWLEGLLEDV